MPRTGGRGEVESLYTKQHLSSHEDYGSNSSELNFLSIALNIPRDLQYFIHRCPLPSNLPTKPFNLFHSHSKSLQLPPWLDEPHNRTDKLDSPEIRRDFLAFRRCQFLGILSEMNEPEKDIQTPFDLCTNHFNRTTEILAAANRP